VAQAVVQVNGEQTQVEGRAATMIGYLAANWRRVNVAQKGYLRFDFADGEMTPSINAIDAPLIVQPENGGRQQGR